MHEFKLPEIGEGVVEGEIVQWLKQPGERVVANEPLVEVMTDKATVEIPSPATGTVQSLKADEGDICPVGDLIALIEEGDAPATTAAPAAAADSPGAAASDHEIPATPAARALARERGIVLSSIAPNAGGRITKREVLAHESTAATPATPAPPPVAAAPAAARTPASPVVEATPVIASPPRGAARPSARPASPAPVRVGDLSDRHDETIPFRGLRRVIADGLVRSYSTAVHYTYVEQINVSRLVALRKQAKAAAAEEGVSLTYLPFIIKASIHALRKYPIVNAMLDEDAKQIVMKKRYHIGVATATDSGLMVPVLRDADQLSLLDIAREVRRLGEGARTGQLARDELSGSTFSITSLGTIGGVLATPILNHPEVGIMGVHAIRKTPIVNERDEIVIGHMMNLSMSFDHRVVDGFEGASFLQEVKRYLENPNLLLLASI